MKYKRRASCRADSGALNDDAARQPATARNSIVSRCPRRQTEQCGGVGGGEAIDLKEV